MQAARIELVLTDLLEGSREGARAEIVRRRDDLLEGRREAGEDPAVPGVAAWTIFKPIFTRHLAAIRRPAGQSSNVTTRIRRSNTRHDHLGGALWGYTAAVLEDPDASQASKDAATKIRAQFLKGRAELALTDAQEIANARARQPLLHTLEADLRLIPAADGRTCLDVATAMIKAALDRAALMGERGATAAAPSVENTAWSRALSALLDFRVALQREMEGNEDLPDNLEDLVFGLFDAQRG